MTLWQCRSTLLIVLVGAGCDSREEVVELAALSGQVTLVQAGAYGHPGQLGFGLRPQRSWDAHRCPVLHRDAQLSANGIPAPFESRGGSVSGLASGSLNFSYHCAGITATLEIPPPFPSVLDLIVSDASASFHMRTEQPMQPPTIALAGGPSDARPGDPIELALTPAHLSFLRGGITFRPDDPAAPQVRVAARLSDGLFSFDVPDAANGRGAWVLDQPLVEIPPTQCEGVSACRAEMNGAGYWSPGVPFTIHSP